MRKITCGVIFIFSIQVCFNSVVWGLPLANQVSSVIEKSAKKFSRAQIASKRYEAVSWFGEYLEYTAQQKQANIYKKSSEENHDFDVYSPREFQKVSLKVLANGKWILTIGSDNFSITALSKQYVRFGGKIPTININNQEKKVFIEYSVKRGLYTTERMSDQPSVEQTPSKQPQLEPTENTENISPVISEKVEEKKKETPAVLKERVSNERSSVDILRNTEDKNIEEVSKMTEQTSFLGKIWNAICGFFGGIWYVLTFQWLFGSDATQTASKDESVMVRNTTNNNDSSTQRQKRQSDSSTLQENNQDSQVQSTKTKKIITGLNLETENRFKKALTECKFEEFLSQNNIKYVAEGILEDFVCKVTSNKGTQAITFQVRGEGKHYLIIDSTTQYELQLKADFTTCPRKISVVRDAQKLYLVYDPKKGFVEEIRTRDEQSKPVDDTAGMTKNQKYTYIIRESMQNDLAFYFLRKNIRNQMRNGRQGKIIFKVFPSSGEQIVTIEVVSMNEKYIKVNNTKYQVIEAGSFISEGKINLKAPGSDDEMELKWSESEGFRLSPEKQMPGVQP